MLATVEEKIERARGSEYQGTSGLYWERIAILDRLNK
jgi:hypothetical protein